MTRTVRCAYVLVLFIGLSLTPSDLKADTWSMSYLLRSVDWSNPSRWNDPDESDGQFLPGTDDTVEIYPSSQIESPFITLDTPVTVTNLFTGTTTVSTGTHGFAPDFNADFIAPQGGQDLVVRDELEVRGIAFNAPDIGGTTLAFTDTRVQFFDVNIAADVIDFWNAEENSEGSVLVELFEGSITFGSWLNVTGSRLNLYGASTVFAPLDGRIRIERSSGTIFSSKLGRTIQANIQNAGNFELESVTEGDRVATVIEGAVSGSGDWHLGNQHELVLRRDTAPTSGFIGRSQITGDIVGPGRLRIEGAGNVVEILGANSVSDGMIVDHGATLIVGSGSKLGAFGANFLSLAEGSKLLASNSFTIGLPTFSADGIFDTGGNSLNLTGPLTGSAGGVTRKIGDGTLTLQNNASGHAGDWVVEQGDLVSGSNADTFSDTTSVTVEAAGTLRFFDHEDFAGIEGDGRVAIATDKQMRIGYDDSDYDFAGQLSGPGDVVKWGTGYQRFSGDNTGHTGSWTLNEGTFRFGSGKSLSGDLVIGSGKTIFFDPESGESDYAHSLSGTGSVFMTGSGAINLTGDSSGFTGTLFVTHPTQQGGTLNVEGTIAPSVVGIESNATLGGGGDILGTATALSHGTIRPDAEAGRLRVNGVDFRSESIFGVDIASVSEYSTLRVLGDVAVNDATLDIDLLDGFLPTHGDSFLVLQADGAVSGSGFSAFDLPEIPGMEWDTSQLLTDGLISIEVTLPGDYNLDGTVDAADYTVWRDNLGEPEGVLASDVDGGAIGHAQYDTWVAHFGQSLANPAAAVPEPGAALLIVGLALGLLGGVKRSR